MADHLAIALLAAGASRRFGEKDKLAAIFRGKMLGLHAAHTVPAALFDTRLVIASRADHPCAEGWVSAGFTMRTNPDAARGMGTSVALAARCANEAGADALLIALADMPLVRAGHFTRIAQHMKASQPDAIIASCKDDKAMPPACFGKAHFERLQDLDGDEGARAILRDARMLACPPEWLADIDTPEALSRSG